MLKASLDSGEIMRQYGQALRRLAELSGFDQRAVLLGEAGVILKTWAGRTKVATNREADRRTWRHVIGPDGLGLNAKRVQAPGDISVNMGIRGQFGRVWVRTSGRRGSGRPYRLAGTIDPRSYAFRPENRHWKRGTWVDIKEAAEDVAYEGRKKIPKGRAATGLARQSVVQIADALGIDLLSVKGGGSLSAAGIAKARAAMATSGRQHKNGTGSVAGEQINTVVTLMNNLPYATKPSVGMDKTLRGILAGRAKFFQQSYAKGAFDTMTSAARAYPWMRVIRPAGV
jgi:hypothetical protein